MLPWLRRLGLAAGLAAALAVAGRVLWLAGAPILTADFWWHLALGEVFVREGGLTLAQDPFSHTARGAPDPHEWLFEVALHGAFQVGGFHGLRALHVLGVAGIGLLALDLLRRESRSWTLACAGVALLGVLSWYRLFQLRPDLLSIAATLLLTRLLFEPAGPVSRLRIALCPLLFGLWVNVHSLFAVGLALGVAALLGLGLRELAARLLLDPRERRGLRTGASAAALALALGLGLAATLANPKGPEALLTFVRASSGLELWRIGDEWTPFDPFSWRRDVGGLSPLAWVTADAIGVAFAIAALAGAGRVWRQRDAASLLAADPLRLGLGAASVVAILGSHRFLWLALFPLLFSLRVASRQLAERGLPRVGLEVGLAAAALTAALLLPSRGGMASALRALPERPAEYLALPWLPEGFHAHAVRFLRDSGLRGRLFNAYAMGGFLDYWVAPDARTFIDGRLNIESDVLLDYFAVLSRSRDSRGERWQQVLERREIDVFLGVGAPTPALPGQRRTYTTAQLEGDPGWMLVWRSFEDAVYLRRGPDGRENLERVRRYYEREGVPFDTARGLDVAAVLRERPDWALRQGWVPEHLPQLEAARGGGPLSRARALEALGLLHALLGSYEEGLRLDAEAVALRPRAKAPRRRRVHAWIRLGRGAEALAEARELMRLDPSDPWSRGFLDVAREWLRIESAGGSPGRALAPAIAQLPVVAVAELRRLRRSSAPARLEPARRGPAALAAPREASSPTGSD